MAPFSEGETCYTHPPQEHAGLYVIMFFFASCKVEFSDSHKRISWAACKIVWYLGLSSVDLVAVNLYFNKYPRQQQSGEHSSSSLETSPGIFSLWSKPQCIRVGKNIRNMIISEKSRSIFLHMGYGDNYPTEG